MIWTIIRFEVFEGQRISAARSRQYLESLISLAGIDRFRAIR
jgi:hypothetical protein